MLCITEEKHPVDGFRRRVPERCDSTGGNLLQRASKDLPF